MPFPYLFPWVFDEFLNRWIKCVDIEDTLGFHDIDDSLVFTDIEDTIRFTEVEV